MVILVKLISAFRFGYANLILLWLAAAGCATHYQQNIAFQNAISAGNYLEAIDHLEKDGTVRQNKNRLLYYLEKGSALHMAGNYAASNDEFEKAYIYIEDFMRNYGLEAFSFLTNPAIVPYPGEDFERVQVHYFKALNDALAGNIPDALVECRRINIKLNEINDNYEAGKKNHYGSDAFAWTLMGLLHDAAHEYNNAFICYRNALEVYETSYETSYGVTVPKTLLVDLVTAAHRAGLKEEFRDYKARYVPDWKSPDSLSASGDVVIFWNNGLGPVKTEDSVNFFINRGDGGIVTFVSEDQNLWLPVPTTGSDTSSIKDLRFIRLALPRYLERTPVCRSCTVKISDDEIPLEKAQNINGIAFLNLQDRMGRELGKALLRVAIKYGIEQAVRKQDQAAGAMVSILNALTEKADTRNWQTLPYEIHYAHVSLPAGSYPVTFSRLSVDGSVFETERLVDVTAGQTVFMTLFDPESLAPGH